MISDVLAFKLQLDHFARVVVPQEHQKMMKAIAVRLYDDLTKGPTSTPTDTGWHRANWSVKVGRGNPSTDYLGTYPALERGKYQPMSRSSYGDVLGTIRGSGLGQEPFLWLYNNASGIEALEDGHSKQAPAGMLAHALNNIQTFVDTI